MLPSHSVVANEDGTGNPNQLVNFDSESFRVVFCVIIVAAVADVGESIGGGGGGGCCDNSYRNRSNDCKVRIWMGSMVSDDTSW